MPRPPQSPAPQLSPGEASYVLDRLISERRLSQGEINRYRSEMSREIDELEQRLQRLREAQGGGGGARTSGGGGASAETGGGSAAPARRRRRRAGAGGPGRPPGRRGRPAAAAGAAASGGSENAGAETQQPVARGRAKRGGRKQRSAITAEQLASRQLQGRYLALVRRFPATKRGQYAKIAKDRGREAAIREMQSALNK